MKTNKLISRLGLLSLIFVLMSCAKGQTQMKQDTTKGMFKEDLTAYRPKYDTDSAPAKTSSKETKSTPPANGSNTGAPPTAGQTADARVDSVAARNKSVNKSAQGYRVLVYSGNSSEESRKVRERIYKILPDADIYAQYKQPTFRVKVGDCFNRIEANNLYVKLKEEFPEAKIVPDQINIIVKE
ncbi:hypothetical protein [Sporocytophaga myxococcoides]|uniref:hypothetical protein n=1 Tax=Sporocytophaga myxococcoides TaxID=153721 RepID=UPI000560F307|nr:hypothetical protein [Sporocytophaga myxococcoides]